MKKIFLFTVLCLVGGTAFAQKKNVSRANNELKQEKPNYEEARLLLKEARENPETQNDAKTWWVSAEVEDAIFLQNDQKRITNQSYDDAAMYRLWKMSMHIFNKPFIWIRFLMQKIKFRPNTLKESLVVYMIDI